MKYQSVKAERMLNGVTAELSKIYAIFSNLNYTQDLLSKYPLDYRTKPIIDVIAAGANKEFKVTYDDLIRGIDSRALKNSNKIIVCFSGGKDSTAAAITMKEMGFDVHLYYVQGINKSYPDEKAKALAIAKTLDLPLHIESVRLSGKTTFHDNPIKNQLIASMAMDYGLNNGIGGTVCFGDFITDNIRNSSFLEAWSDTQEMWVAFEKYVHCFLLSAKVVVPFRNYIETMNIIASRPDVLRLVQGCVLPHRFRQRTKEQNEQKYGVSLLPNRCGSCWKCCVEYIHYADIGVLEYNDLFYKHCLEFLKLKMPILHPNIKDKSLASVYNAFLFNDFNNSEYAKHNL